MKIKIPGHKSVTIESESDIFIEVPSDGPIEVVEAVVSGGPSGSGFLREDSGYILREDSSYLLREA
jgi:hypothetical protein